MHSAGKRKEGCARLCLHGTYCEQIGSGAETRCACGRTAQIDLGTSVFEPLKLQHGPDVILEVGRGQLATEVVRTNDSHVEDMFSFVGFWRYSNRRLVPMFCWL